MRAGSASDALQKAWAAANAAPSHGRLNPWSWTPGLQQWCVALMPLANGSRHCAVGCAGAGGAGGPGGPGGGHGLPPGTFLQQRPLWQHSTHSGAPHEPGGQGVSAGSWAAPAVGLAAAAAVTTSQAKGSISREGGGLSRACGRGYNNWICESECCMYVWKRLHVHGRRISGRARRRRKFTDSYPFYFFVLKKKFFIG
jgi:hypothetical protein